jgi:hypothetical protein
LGGGGGGGGLLGFWRGGAVGFFLDRFVAQPATCWWAPPAQLFSELPHPPRLQTPFDIATAEVDEDEYEDYDVIQALLAKMDNTASA